MPSLALYRMILRTIGRDDELRYAGRATESIHVRIVLSCVGEVNRVTTKRIGYEALAVMGGSMKGRVNETAANR